MIIKRIFAVIFVLSLIIVPLQVTAQTLDFILGTDSDTPTIVVFGERPWFVIGHNGEGVASQEGTLTLLAANNLFWGATPFCIMGQRPPRRNGYGGSHLYNTMNRLFNALSPDERNAVVLRDFIAGTPEGGILGNDVTNAGVWPMSWLEAGQLTVAVRAFATEWWTRTPAQTSGNRLGSMRFVDRHGGIAATVDASVSLGVRPAVILDLSAVTLSPDDEGRYVAEPLPPVLVPMLLIAARYDSEGKMLDAIAMDIYKPRNVSDETIISLLPDEFKASRVFLWERETNAPIRGPIEL